MFTLDRRWAALPTVTSLLLSSFAWGADFSYPSFTGGEPIQLRSDAAVVAPVLRLTAAGDFEAGAAWTMTKPQLDQGFTTEFTIDIHGGTGADGMAFVIQDAGPNALGGDGGRLGYGGIPRSLAVEFDTCGVCNNEPFAQHIAVHSRGAGSNSASAIGVLGMVQVTDLRDGSPDAVRIQYRPGSLAIFYNNSPLPILEVAVDLEDINGAPILDIEGRAWIGFTGATAMLHDNHDVTSWDFFEAAPGDVNRNGCVDLSDLATLLADFGCVSNCSGDADFDGDADLSDLAALLANFGEGC